MNKITKPSKLSEDFAELEQITSKFENEEINLEEGIPLFKRGLKLAKELKNRITSIENEITEIKDDFADLD
ncbi:exodeoxyribonuclease VII small subunit [Candidatus Roizmanbacteria bacterium CG22_combo_CG10-13_8_21_14_all_38_20]|uniref:Exodeoxyribonuclease 7 small subunit n=1 Tax=Candidatus Roizmanbacteria bacterium CG22_combo_CG10-13_8_21_14_all_38_20 TaxID=1974862 RepID=A0A2H0BWG4_9BACT|nr:exodeoxyribonuclease VII small subunit [Candidatus Microgenomates bacterium]PIP62015.1 MAG: exodeoxyribonuclease VII small subunit [Candidatus Roizmanbacteria bacterium CG22_combo_CG10-13_8_21_14_all_38_20]PJC31326.1 MAG: exodeoxyribonuclease VII small subunit [Candidatus Roizmanbacteria bacterium CG_4_9_14_0_2_um_filter_38_17]